MYNRLFAAYHSKDTDGAKLEQRRSQAMVKMSSKYGVFHHCGVCVQLDPYPPTLAGKGRGEGSWMCMCPPPPPPIIIF